MASQRRLARNLAIGACVALAIFASGFYTFASAPRSDLGLGAVLRNVREVDPGRFYRSGQLPPDTLHEVIQTFGIRTVINLRGYGNADWREAELGVTRELGVAHHDVHLSSRSMPRKRQLLKLLELYRDAAQPILVHCLGGADRSGEASALWMIEHRGRSNEEALEMLTPRYRHLPWVRPAKRAFIRAYRGEDWLRDEYDECGPEWGDLRRPSTCDR